MNENVLLDGTQVGSIVYLSNYKTYGKVIEIDNKRDVFNVFVEYPAYDGPNRFGWFWGSEIFLLNKEFYDRKKQDLLNELKLLQEASIGAIKNHQL